MKKVPVLPSILSAVELSLRSKRNLYFTEAALYLLLTLARTPQVGTKLHAIFVYWCYNSKQAMKVTWGRLKVLQDTHEYDGVSFVLQGAAAVAAAGATQTICLPLLSVYEGSSNGASQVAATCISDFFFYPVCSHICSTQSRLSSHLTDPGNLSAEFHPEVPGCCMLARSLPSVCVFDGEFAQDTSLQLHQWSSGLCGSAPRTHSTGKRQIYLHKQITHQGLWQCSVGKIVVSCSVWTRCARCRAWHV